MTTKFPTLYAGHLMYQDQFPITLDQLQQDPIRILQFCDWYSLVASFVHRVVKSYSPSSSRVRVSLWKAHVFDSLSFLEVKYLHALNTPAPAVQAP